MRHLSLTIVLAFALGCTDRVPPTATVPTAAAPQHGVDVAAIRPQVEAFCGGCHATPRPASFPRDRWAHEVERGYEFYLLSGRTDLALPRQSDVTAYYQQLAHGRLVMDAAPPGKSARFVKHDLPWPARFEQQMAVAHILALPDRQIAYCDMRGGTLNFLAASQSEFRLLGSVPAGHPDHVTRTDLDADGQADYLVCDLGSFLPEDHDRGRVVWVRPPAGGEGEMSQTVLLDKVGRVADAQPADFDGDGDLDIVVAVFGWRTTGSVVLLRQDPPEAGRLKFTPEVLDERDGAIHVPVADLNADGRPDFVALFSQEHESVEAFVSSAGGKFDRQVLYRGPDPAWGSSGIQLVDLDADADLDILYTNGDTFDSYYVKPYHSIRWIENRGELGWHDRPLANLPGVHRALAGDLDGDGDLDIAACAFISPLSVERQPEIEHLSSLVWLEQRGGQFTLHEIEADNAVHATLELADIDDDGDLDILAGTFGQSPAEGVVPLTIWRNEGP